MTTTTDPINLVHRVITPRAATPGSAPTLLLLHGRGADENDLAALAPRLDPRLLVVSVRAPYPFPYGGYTWYNLLQVGEPDAAMFQKSYLRLSKFLDVLPRLYAVDAQRLFSMGFSMGTVMSYALALTMPERFAGTIAHSGYVPETVGLNLRWSELAGTHFFIAHGTNDQVIRVEFGRRANELFEQTDADFVYKEYPIAHEISVQSLRDLAAWLTQRIGE